MKNYIFGHNNSNNAYVIDDYPYGFRERTKMRVWIETKPIKGDRMVTQTLNPKTQNWNKPKESTFNLIGALYLDDQNHIKWDGISQYSTKDQITKFVQEIGGESKLNPEQLKQYKHLKGEGDNAEIKYTAKFDKLGDKVYSLDLRFDVANTIKLGKIVDAIDFVIGKLNKSFKALLDNDGSVRVFGRNGVMLANMSAKKLYDQIKGNLQNKIKENKELTKIKLSEIRRIIKEEVAKELMKVTEKISPEERKTYVEFGNELKKYLQSKYKIQLKLDTLKSDRPNPFIRFFGDIPNELRVKIMKGSGWTANDWSNVSYGNIQNNYLSLHYSEWKRLKDNNII